MNHKTDNGPLLAEVLAEAAPADFRDAMLGETLRLICRRRRRRQTRSGVAVLVLLGLCGFFFWQKNVSPRSRAPAPVTRAVSPNYQLVQTRPLSAGAIVATQPLAAGQIIASGETIGVVQTSRGNYHVLDDVELLALVSSHPAVLIRTGPHSEELVFANPEDQKGFPLN